MEANQDKFPAMMLGLKSYDNCKCQRYVALKLNAKTQVKLLGDTFDYMLNFDLHIANFSKKAARQINDLLRLNKYLTLETKSLIYKSFKRSNINYYPHIWHFCSNNLSSADKTEKLQYRVQSVVLNDFNISEDLLKD